MSICLSIEADSIASHEGIPTLWTSIAKQESCYKIANMKAPRRDYHVFSV